MRFRTCLAAAALIVATTAGCSQLTGAPTSPDSATATQSPTSSPKPVGCKIDKNDVALVTTSCLTAEQVTKAFDVDGLSYVLDQEASYSGDGLITAKFTPTDKAYPEIEFDVNSGQDAITTFTNSPATTEDPHEKDGYKALSDLGSSYELCTGWDQKANKFTASRAYYAEFLFTWDNSSSFSYNAAPQKVRDAVQGATYSLAHTVISHLKQAQKKS
jgi:hypothetical protein